MPRYALTLFASAFLLFGVQPLVGKFALPWFGGTPAVWTACMLFFQAALLAGYAYAHLVATRLTPRAQVKLHLVNSKTHPSGVVVLSYQPRAH